MTRTAPISEPYLRLAQDLLRHVKEHSHQQLQVQHRHRLLDVGCGPGTDTIPLASRHPTCEVWGVDADARFIQQAALNAAHLGNVQHQVAQAQQLPFQDGEFDGVRCERLLQHLDHPLTAVREMARVLQPSGRLVILETDYSSLQTTSKHPEIEKRLIGSYRHFVATPAAAGQLSDLAQFAGLQVVHDQILTVATTSFAVSWDALVWGHLVLQAQLHDDLTPQQLEKWRTDLLFQQQEGHFRCQLNLRLLVGVKA